MSDAVIQCEGIGKRYVLGQRQRYRALRDTLTDAIRAPFRGLRAAFKGKRTAPLDGAESLWALRDVSFEVRQGEVLGIIGRNGAGKSTLLKILARITAPTEGKATIHGRMGTLLEVGTGFHPELTGRENIYLNGAILGMTKVEIERRFEEIVTFSECGRFLDTQIKHYSSGMYMRLAFSVAAHLETEILFVDEVLAVGDAAFQKKCLGKMGEAARQGRTVLFISHNLLAVESLCSRAICLHEGKIVMEGPPRKVTFSYLQNWISSTAEVTYEDIATAPGNDTIRLHCARLRPLDGSPGDPITVRTSFSVELDFWKLVPHASLDVSVSLYNEHGTHVFNTWWLGDPSLPPGELRSSFTVPGDLLNTGMHHFSVKVWVAETDAIDLEQLLVFDVKDSSDLRGMYHGEWPGVVRPNLEWKMEHIGSLPLRDDAVHLTE